MGLVRRIKAKGKERKSLLAEKKATPKLRIARHRELLAARLALRPERDRSAAARLQAADDDKFKALTLYDSKLDAANLLCERSAAQSVRNRLKEKMTEQKQCPPKKSKHRERTLTFAGVYYCIRFIHSIWKSGGRSFRDML